VKFSERIGVALSYPLGWLTGSVAFIRQSRTFHPRGLTFRAEVSAVPNASGLNLFFYPHALIRLSSAWWKHKEWIDVLGIAIRFSKSEIITESALTDDQDLLFATVTNPWLTAVSPLMTHYHDFLKNDYYAVSPFAFGQHTLYFRLKPLPHAEAEAETRNERLSLAVLNGDAGFEIQVQSREKDWVTVAQVRLTSVIQLNQNILKFSPFQTGLGIRPKGFVHSLRVGAYYFSQKLRPH
jgi:hypothetical protein